MFWGVFGELISGAPALLMYSNPHAIEAGYGTQQAMDLSTVLPMKSKRTPPLTPTHLPLVDACAAYGIGRTTAFKLQKEGVLETFKVGSRRHVHIRSLDALPERLMQKSLEPRRDASPQPADPSLAKGDSRQD